MEDAVGLKFGVCLPNYGGTGTVETVTAVALEAERLGYDSVWSTDHILMPANSGTPYDIILESITLLAYLAGITRRIKLGISSLILAMRNPVIATKQLATVDRLSGGRLMLALGTGWNAAEFGYLGSNFHDRGKRLNESIRLIRTLWQGGAVQFEGPVTGLKFSNAIFEPRPIQDHLPIWVAGNGKPAMVRAATFGDAWHPNVTPLDQFRGLVSEFRSMPGGEQKPICVRIGINREGKSMEFRAGSGERRLLLTGDMKENRKVISQLEGLGVGYALVATSPNGNVPEKEQIETLRVFAESFFDD